MARQYLGPRKQRTRQHVIANQHYFGEEGTRQPKKDAKAVRVRVPMQQAVNRRAVAKWRKIVKEPLGRLMGAILRVIS